MEEPCNSNWTISNLYLPIVGYCDRAKFRADFSRSGGVHVGIKPEYSIGASLNKSSYRVYTYFDPNWKNDSIKLTN
jgi:hypothetical protein